MIFNPKPILERIPMKRQDRTKLAVSAEIEVRTIERFLKEPQKISFTTLERLIRMTGAPYSEVFDEKFFNQNQN